MAILALTFDLVLHYSVVDTLYAFTYFIFNVIGAGIMIIWEVKERYL